ncbi:MAG: 1-acyl-sn-glycerol-3-phosphate acyltransferase, partial [Actinomycetospora chiangmaiensis]|nr:1-acyl-sn-glycerol-3-phosphate acyltransferase [Actinomycetospora chiangmaiensis]
RQDFQALAQERLESASNALVDGGLDGLAASGHAVPAEEAPAAAAHRR